MSKKLRKSSVIAAFVFSGLSFAPRLTLAAETDLRFTYDAYIDQFHIDGLSQNTIQALEITFSENMSLNQNYYEDFLDDGSLYILSKNKIFIIAATSDTFLKSNFDIKLNSDVALNGDIEEVKYFYSDSLYETVKDPSYTVSGNANDYYQENVFAHEADESGGDSIGEIVIDIYDYYQSNKDIYHYLEDHYIEDTIDSINDLAADEDLDPKLKITLNTNYAIDSFDIAMDSVALSDLIDLPNASLAINTEIGSFEFDAVALQGMLDETKGEIHFRIIPTTGETSAQEKVIGNRTAYLVGIFESTANSSMLDPLEGEINVELAFQRGGMDEDDVRAYCVFKNGDVKIMDSRYFASSDEVRITLDEFGTYMIADENDENKFDIVEDQREEEEEDKEEDKDDDDDDDDDWWDDNDDDDGGGYRPGGGGGYTPPYVPPYVPPTVTPTPTPTPNIPTITLPPTIAPTVPTKDDAYYLAIKHTFTDISSKDWFYKDVLDMYKAGYVHGMTDTKFDPQGVTTRAQLATILYLIAETPNTFTTNNYTDVAYSDWFAKQVTWSAENEIFNEYVDKKFKPNANITREELVYAIYRFAKYEEIPILGISSIYAFTDGAQVSAWAIDALQWAIANGILAGKEGNRLDPKGTATRAEICAIVNRFLKSYDLKAIREARKALEGLK